MPVSVLTSKCYAERHCAVPPSVSSLAWHRRLKLGASITWLRISCYAWCVQCVPRTTTWCGAVRRYFGDGCSLVSGICVCRSLQSFGEATRLPRMPVACRCVSVRRFCVGSRNDEVMRNNLCGGIALGLTLVPSHPPAFALCVFSRRFVVSLPWRLCLCSSRWSGRARAIGRLSEVLATCGLQLIGLILGLSRSLQVFFFLVLFRLLCRIGW